MTSPAFERLSRDPGFQELFRSGKRRNVPKAQVILQEGDSPASLYFVMSGTVSVQLLDWHGEETLLALMHAGDFFGEMGLFPDTPLRSATVRAATECNLLEVAYPVFMSLTQRHPSLWLELAGQLATRVRTLNRRLAEMPRLPASDRVWRVVAELAEHAQPGKDPRGVPLRIRREDLGQLAGCSREVAGLALQQFARENRVVLDGQTIIVCPRPLASGSRLGPQPGGAADSA